MVERRNNIKIDKALCDMPLDSKKEMLNLLRKLPKDKQRAVLEMPRKTGETDNEYVKRVSALLTAYQSYDKLEDEMPQKCEKYSKKKNKILFFVLVILVLYFWGGIYILSKLAGLDIDITLIILSIILIAPLSIFGITYGLLKWTKKREDLQKRQREINSKQNIAPQQPDEGDHAFSIASVVALIVSVLCWQNKNFNELDAVVFALAAGGLTYCLVKSTKATLAVGASIIIIGLVCSAISGLWNGLVGIFGVGGAILFIILFLK